MKAIIRVKSGKDLSTMQIQEIEKPKRLLKNEIRVQMVSSRINPVDIDLMKGMPFLKYKKQQIEGIDGAGKVLEIGQGVQNVQIGDHIFFYQKFTDIGTWAEEIIINDTDIAKIPDNIPVEEAGAITLPLLTAYDALLQLNLQKENTILIHGAGGGVGFQAAINKGLKVIATAGENDFEVLEKIGVSKIINYKTQDFSEELKNPSVNYIFDTIGKEVLIKSIQLAPQQISVHYIDASKMIKTGIQMPKIVKWLLGLSMSKFRKLAKKHNVQLIGQVTGANGELLQEVSDQVGTMDYSIREYQKIELQEIETKGLGKSDLGKVIIM
ncbi:MAG: NADP-dependent oxidoreductase [Cytophagales bacterium]|nr:NADP-dependent oxidoreductase [Cytophagales bacterium]